MDDQSTPNGRKAYPVPVDGFSYPSIDVTGYPPDFEDSVTLHDYLDIVLRRKWLVLLVLAVVFTATLVYTYRMQPLFMASGRMEVNPDAPQVTKFKDVNATSNRSYDLIKTQIELLRSKSLADRVVKKLAAERSRSASNRKDRQEDWKARIHLMLADLRGSVKHWLELIGLEKPKQQPDPALAALRAKKARIGWFLSSLGFSSNRDTNILTVSFSSTDPYMARDAVNSLLGEFISWETDKRIDAAKAAKKQLEKQIDLARIQLEASENKLNKFAQQAGIVSLDANLNLVYKQLQDINNALSAAQADRIAKESLYQAVTSSNDVGSLPQAAQNPLLQQLRSDYLNALTQYQELSVNFKDDYPTVKNLKSKIANLKKQITGEQERIRDTVKNDYRIALAKEHSLQEDAAAKKTLALKLNNQATQYKIFEREVETNRQIYQSLLERSKEIDANVGTNLSNIRIIDYADLPLAPYKPDVRRNLLLALVVGLMAGLGLAFALEYFDNTIKRLDEISERFQLPVLGVLPLVDRNQDEDLNQLVQSNPRSTFAEAVRTAKISIQMCSLLDQPPKTILITSTTQGEGKSTVAGSLAQTFASPEQKVVLIDADLRRPSLDKIFCQNGDQNNGTSNGNGRHEKPIGITHFLSGLCKLEDALQKTATPNLYFLPAGFIPPNPTELLASSRMQKLLEALDRHFDRVILDTPPATGFADVLAMSKYVDGIILISTLGQTQREALRILRKSLYNVGGQMLGCIVNKLNFNQHYAKYYQYYRYYHYPNYEYGRPERMDSLSELENKS